MRLGREGEAEGLGQGVNRITGPKEAGGLGQREKDYWKYLAKVKLKKFDSKYF